MKKRILSIILALCLCVPLLPTAQAEEGEEEQKQEGVLTEEAEKSEDELLPYAAKQVEVELGDWDTSKTYPDYVYNILISFKEKDGFTEGTTWTNDTHTYNWHGNNDDAFGCAAFAFALSDAVFGTLPARSISPVKLSDVRVGDVLRINSNSHSVIVLQVNSEGVVIAEGNYNSQVHWERTLTKADVEDADFMYTRYPVGYDPEVDFDAPITDENGNPVEGTIDGSSLTWKVTVGGALVISGSGDMPDMGSTSQPWNAYKNRILSVEIANGVTSVGNNAFRNYASLVSVSIPESVTSIGERVFESCAALTSITLPASVTSVGSAAFLNCQELESVVFTSGSNAVTLGDSMFMECWALKTVTLPKQMDGPIGDNMFKSCSSLTSLTIPDGATGIGALAFASCSALKQLAIPNSVEEFGTAGAFNGCSCLTDIYFSGTKDEWDSIYKNVNNTTALENVTIHYGETMPGTPDTSEPSNPSETPPSQPAEHTHTYGAWVIDQNATAYQSGSRHRVCTICGYTQTESIPATGGTSNGNNSSSSRPSTPSNSNSSNSSNSSSNTEKAEETTTTTTTENPDGSITTTLTDNATGTVTETTEHQDGSQTVVETQTDGTVTTRETDADGNQTETVANPDGTGRIVVEQSDGTTAAVTLQPTGVAEAEIRLSSQAVSAVQQGGEAVLLPIPALPVAGSTRAAPAVTVNTGSEAPVKVEIPAVDPTPGTVAVIVHADGTEEVVKTSVPTENGVAVSLPDGAMVKIVDNSKDFMDISAQYWATDAIRFVSARELFAGTTETDFAPEAPMTRAMLMVVLARLDGVDTSAGATWYENGMEWAVANGISDGSDPDQSITREQLVTMLWRYMGSPSAANALSGFADAGQISGYAQEAMCWAVENGIVSGFDGGLLGPQGQATRAQVAQMLMNFIEK